MTLGESSSDATVEKSLRERAEALISDDVPDLGYDMSRSEMIRELQLQRIEMELQNQELERYRHRDTATQNAYADLYFNAPVGYLVLDEEAGIDAANYRATELLGANRETVEDSALFDYLAPGFAPKLQDHLDAVSSNPGVHQTEVLIDLPTETKACIKLVSIAVNDNPQGRRQCRTALLDFTEQNLDRRKHQRLEVQLRKAHRMETLGRLANGIAHDFNNLLTLIIGYSKLAINTLPDDHPLSRHVAEINKAGHHASELIEQLLAFSRSDDTSSNPIDANERIRDMATMFDRLIGDDIELQLGLHDRLGRIHFDSSQFQQVLLNLVVNARDAMEEGGHLYIRTRNETLDANEADRLELTAGPHVIIEVEDEGKGIAPEVIPHIFEPFFTTKKGSKNHGYGLSTTYGIVNHHQGTIDVLSESGEGTTFQIYLPRISDDDRDDEEATIPAILVVDDQPDLREFASLVLDEMGVEVLSAHSPEHALQLSRTYGDSLTLVVTDVTMPGMSGPKLLDEIRKYHPASKVLYISGHDRERLCTERDLAPDAPFLEKPFCPDSLRESVNALLTKADSENKS